MKDKDLKILLQQIDNQFKALLPLLEKAGEALVEKAKREHGVELNYSLGWEEGGIECLCLQRGKKNFDTWEQGCQFEEKSVEPLFEGLEILWFDAPFGLS